MPFDAATAVEPMDYDFTKYAVDEQGKPLSGAKGTVPEPSQDEFRTYTRALTEIQGDFKALEKEFEKDDLSVAELKKLGDTAEKLGKKIDKLVGTLCHNVPSEEIVAMLPFRVKNAFSKWLQSEFAPKA